MAKENLLSTWQQELRPGDLIGVAMHNSGIFPAVFIHRGSLVNCSWQTVTGDTPIEISPNERGRYQYRSAQSNTNPPTASTYYQVSKGYIKKDWWLGDVHFIALHVPLNNNKGQRVSVTFNNINGGHVPRRVFPYPEKYLTPLEVVQYKRIRQRFL